uniref:DDE Tnp4 domain-containing protein n=1 Tax=Cyprinus carpio TaxID=7962 RepID=A0A8C2HNS4_CYPCA
YDVVTSYVCATLLHLLLLLKVCVFLFCFTQGNHHHLVQELYNDRLRFKSYFMLTLEPFELLHEKVPTRTDTNMRKPIRSKERFSICLRFLATGDSFVNIAFSHRVGTSTVATIVDEVTRLNWDVLWKFPDFTGAIDGKHVVLQAPPNSGSLHFNYKGTRSIVLLALVDAHYLFHAIDVGIERGKTWHSSGQKALDLCHMFLLEMKLSRCKINLMRLSPVVDNVFGILSNQWRVYRRVMALTPEKAEAIVKATCILHHFCF